MPELNNTFIKGRMNKDLDDRLVPQGEYRDALNIEVSTSESSDVGTVQNLKGNKDLSSDTNLLVSKENLYTTRYITIYQSNSSGSIFYYTESPANSGITSTSDNSYKIKHYSTSNSVKKTIKSTLLEVGKYYTLSFDFEVNLRSYGDQTVLYKVGLVDLNTEFSSLLETNRGQVVNDGVASGFILKSFYCESENLGIYVSDNFSGNLTNIKIVESTALESDTSKGITVGSKADTATDTIYNFVHKASDFKLHTYTTSTGEIKSRMLGIQSDSIIQHKPSNIEEYSINKPVLTDVYKVRIGPIVSSSGKLPMLDLNNNPTLTEITGLPYIIDSAGNPVIQGVRVGMSVSFLSPDNINLWEGLDIKVLKVLYDIDSSTGKVVISQVPHNKYFNQAAIDENFVLEFNSDRVLKFIPGTSEQEYNINNEMSNTPIDTSITAINIVDNYIYYTDNRNEPKKINIKHGLDSTSNIFDHTLYEELNTVNPDTYYLEEKYITVIKAKPTNAPKLLMSNKGGRKGGAVINIVEKEQVPGGEDSSKNHFYSNVTSCLVTGNTSSEGVGSTFSFFDSNENFASIGTQYSIISNVENINWRVGDTLVLKGTLTNAEVDVRIVNAYENTNKFNSFTVKLISFSDEYLALSTVLAESFYATLKSDKVLYEDNFVSFALRYKYNDNEYSAIGPHSEVAFLPSVYSYKSSVGINESMVNTLANLNISNIVSNDLGKDVKSIDIILKDHFTTNAYVIKSIDKKSSEWNLNSYEVLSELRGTTIPSLQLLRNYDAVPLKAKAQEFIASRLMYANYTEGYNMIDHGAKQIDFNSKTDFEIISSNAREDISHSVNENVSNNLYALNVPFFNVEDNIYGASTRYIHNYYQSNGRTLDPSFIPDYGTVASGQTSVNLLCPEDLDTQYGHAGPGTGPEFSRFLIPIFPKNENLSGGNSSTTLIMPSVEDLAGDSLNVGATGNYITTNGFVHNDIYNSSDLPEYSDLDLSPEVKPLLYKAPQAGIYKIKASTKALVRYYYGNTVSEMTATHFNPKFYKDMLFRIELHKVNPETGLSLGIIQSSVDLIGNADGLAVSNLNQGGSYYGGSIGSSLGPNTLYQTRTGMLVSRDIPTSNAPEAKDVEFYREVLLSKDDVIGVFFSYQKSFYRNQQSELYNPHIIENTVGNPYSGSSTIYSENINVHNSVRFLLDCDETKLEIVAPDLIGNIQVASPSKSVRSNRFYETGVVYSDFYGRETTVMISKNSKVEIPISYSDKKNALICEVFSNAPYWATHYKYYVKESSNKYYNLILDGCYNNEGQEETTNYAWLSFNSTDIDKVNVDDNLILKKQHGSNKAVNSSVNKIKVLDISTTAPESANLTQDETSGKFFVKVKYGDITNIVDSSDIFKFTVDGTGPNETYSDNGAVFEVEPDSTVRDGFYWETSKVYPIVLNSDTVSEYIQPGDYVEVLNMYNPSNNTWYYDDTIDSFNSLNTNIKVESIEGALSFPNDIKNYRIDQTCNVKVNSDVFFNVPPIEDASSHHVLFKFVKKDGNYVTARAVQVSGSTIRLIPYTHPTGKISTKVLNKIALPWHNCYQWYNGVETDIVRDDFSGQTLFAYTPETGKQSGFVASDYYSDYRQVTNKSDIIYSQIYNMSSNIDASNQFILADKIVKRLNRSHGQINALIARNNDIIALCEDKILKILSSGKDALFNADGNMQLTASNNVLGQSIPFVGDFGCQHPESIALDEYRIYFVDKARGAVLRLSKDGMTEISSNGMDNWFDEQLQKTQSVIGSFDDDKSEYNITLHEIISTRVSKNVYTLSFDESTKGWTSFKSFIQESGLSLNNKYYTFKKGKLYKHHSNDVLRNNFYGTQHESSVTTLLNAESNIVKSFRTVVYEGSQAEVIKDLSDSNYRNILPSSGWSIETIKTDQQSGQVDEFVEKEGKWFNNIKGKQ